MSGFETFTPIFGGLDGSAVGLFSASTADNYSTITTAGYLNDINKLIKPNDIIYVNYSDTSVFPMNTGLSATFGAFQVTYDSILENWSLVQTAQDVLHSRVALTAAQWNGMYATPILLVPAYGANTLISVDQVDIGLTYGTVVLAGGGVVGAQYDSTVHGAGATASTTLAAATFFVTASTMFQLEDSLGTGAPFSESVNKGIYLSNATGAFTGGTGSTFIVDTYYRIVATV